MKVAIFLWILLLLLPLSMQAIVYKPQPIPTKQVNITNLLSQKKIVKPKTFFKPPTKKKKIDWGEIWGIVGISAIVLVCLFAAWYLFAVLTPFLYLTFFPALSIFSFVDWQWVMGLSFFLSFFLFVILAAWISS